MPLLTSRFPKLNHDNTHTRALLPRAEPWYHPPSITVFSTVSKISVQVQHLAGSFILVSRGLARCCLDKNLWNSWEWRIWVGVMVQLWETVSWKQRSGMGAVIHGSFLESWTYSSRQIQEFWPSTISHGLHSSVQFFTKLKILLKDSWVTNK